MKPRKRRRSQRQTTRRFKRLGVDVQIREARDRVELTLDGNPIAVSLVDGQYHCQLAHPFTGFGSVEAVVDSLLASEGRLWTLHGHVCDERCDEIGHQHGHEHGGPPGHEHDHPGGHGA